LRRLAWLPLALATACGEQPLVGPAPLNSIHMPTGLAVVDHQLLAASSNADLLYADETGGSLLTLDAALLDTVTVKGAINTWSFAGELEIARNVAQVRDVTQTGAFEADHCGAVLDAPIAVFATRGSNTLNRVSVGPAGELACVECGRKSSGSYADPFPVTIGCGPERTSAFIGYLGAANSAGWVSELDLVTGELRTAPVGAGVVRSLVYDAQHDRLYVGELSTTVPTPLRWIELGGCVWGSTVNGGCTVGSAVLPGLPAGTEIRAIALAHPFDLGGGVLAPQRAFVTVRLYDTVLAAPAGGRTTDLGGLLVVLDLVENAQGGVEPRLVRTVPPLEAGTLGLGLQDIRVFPSRGATRRDVIAMSAQDDGIVWIYDDDTQELTSFGRDPATGSPVLGHQPAGLAVDPVATGNVARLWVGSYTDSFVTPIDVPLDNPGLAGFPGGVQRKITGAMP
jgi:hypothetical protein